MPATFLKKIKKDLNIRGLYRQGVIKGNYKNKID